MADIGIGMQIDSISLAKKHMVKLHGIKMSNDRTVDKIVEGIWKDIYNRSGGDEFLGSVWPSVQEEIKEAWKKIVKDAIE